MSPLRCVFPVFASTCHIATIGDVHTAIHSTSKNRVLTLPLSPQAPKQQQQQQQQSSAPAPRARKGEFVDNRIGAGVVGNENMSVNNAPKVGFGDTGAPAIKVAQAPGGKSSGNILGWN
jgi:hypothetical protein